MAPDPRFAALTAAMKKKGKKKPFQRPGQKDKFGKDLDAADQPGGDPGDQNRPPNFRKKMARRK